MATSWDRAVFIAVVFAMLHAPWAAAADKQPARTKWQYRVLTLEHLEKLLDQHADGKKLKEKLHKEKASDQARLSELLEFALNKLGDDGWELVSVNLVGRQGEALLFFKRPR